MMKIVLSGSWDLQADMGCAEHAELEGAWGSRRSKAGTVVVDHQGSTQEDIIAHDTGAGAEAEPLQNNHRTSGGTDQNAA